MIIDDAGCAERRLADICQSMKDVIVSDTHIIHMPADHMVRCSERVSYQQTPHRLDYVGTD